MMRPKRFMVGVTVILVVVACVVIGLRVREARTRGEARVQELSEHVLKAAQAGDAEELHRLIGSADGAPPAESDVKIDAERVRIVATNNEPISPTYFVRFCSGERSLLSFTAVRVPPRVMGIEVGPARWVASNVVLESPGSDTSSDHGDAGGCDKDA